MRKGVSPIIATVILIAITVTIGSLVYRYSIESITQLAPPPNCERVSFDAGIYQNRAYYLDITNTGNEIIVGFNLESKDQFENVDVQKIDINVNPGQSVSEEINIDNLDDAQLRLIPIIKNAKGVALACDPSFGKIIN